MEKDSAKKPKFYISMILNLVLSLLTNSEALLPVLEKI